MDEFKLEVPNNISNLNIVIAFLTSILSQIPSLSEKYLHEMEVVTSEACTNAFKHSNQNTKESIKIILKKFTNTLELMVISSGYNNQIETLSNPQINLTPNGNGNGGFIMKSLTDELIAENRKGEFLITLKKKY